MDAEQHPPIVGIGASAGGVKALQDLFHALPTDTGAAFVVIMHLDPAWRSELAGILGSQTSMSVQQVEDTRQIAPNNVYVIPPNRSLRIADRQISALPFEEPRGQRAPIDHFFRSLADQHADAFFAVILTGAGSDGSLGIKAVKEAGGIVLVQDPHEAEYPSMPHSAIAMEVADFVLPIGDLARRLAELLRRRERAAPPQDTSSQEESTPRILRQSINEEYRSTSEELETSREELQSINKELQTVNNELKLKLESVSRSHSDLQNLMAATDVGTLFLDTMLRIKRFTPRLMRIFNVTPTDEGRPITDVTNQLDYHDLADHARKVLRDLEPIEREIRSRNGRWYLVRMHPYRTMEDKIDGVVVIFVDISERRQVEESLRWSEARLRQEIRLVELSRAPIFVWELDAGITQWNRGSQELYGYSQEEMLGQRKEQVLQTVVPGSSFEALRRSLLKNGSWSGEVQHRAKDGRILTVESQLELVSEGGRRLVLESTRDVTDRRRAEQRQRLLLAELSHRVKNTLTVVQAMARQTLRTATSQKDFVERFDGRLQALASAHKLLLESPWEGAEIGALARSQLQAHVQQDASRLKVQGPRVTLPAELATPFGLVLHELATNAAKYGALSSEKGRVILEWALEERNNHRWLKVRWEEVGGPAVSPPQKRGLGSMLISRGVPGATMRHDFHPEGVVCEIEFELPEGDSNGAPV